MSSEIGEMIRKLRKAKGLTQAGLAKKVGVSTALVGHYETGRSEPKGERLAAFERILGRELALAGAARREPPAMRGAKLSEENSPASVEQQSGEITDSIGNRIRSRRLANGLSQAELAGRLKVSQPTISIWELGKVKPDDHQLKVLESVLGGIANGDEYPSDSQSPISAWLGRAMVQKNFTAPELAKRADVSMATVYNLLNGRAENPQARTMKAIGNALGEQFELEGKTHEAPEVTGIGQLIDFDPYDAKEIPAKPGVYVFYDISQRPIYVGQANNITDRIKDHHEKFWFKRPIVEVGAYIEIKDKVLRNQVETVLIQFLKNNAVMNKNKTTRD